MLTFQFLLTFHPKQGGGTPATLETLHNHEFKADRITVLYAKV